ncbi:MAG: hypothetical protein GY849_19400 [Deltaproteobacteria bacterium]|nr:hypothetical protein [Deltaproteobacteria bacterium]
MGSSRRDEVVHTWGAPALVLMPRVAGGAHHLLCPAGAAHVSASADGAAPDIHDVGDS